jgi:hypothetical protein
LRRGRLESLASNLDDFLAWIITLLAHSGPVVNLAAVMILFTYALFISRWVWNFGSSLLFLALQSKGSKLDRTCVVAKTIIWPMANTASTFTEARLLGLSPIERVTILAGPCPAIGMQFQGADRAPPRLTIDSALEVEGLGWHARPDLVVWGPSRTIFDASTCRHLVERNRMAMSFHCFSIFLDSAELHTWFLPTCRNMLWRLDALEVSKVLTHTRLARTVFALIISLLPITYHHIFLALVNAW